MKKILSMCLVMQVLFFTGFAFADGEYGKATTPQLVGLIMEMESTRNIAHMYQLDAVSSSLGSLEKEIADEIVRRTRKEVEAEVKARKERRQQIKDAKKKQD